MTRTFVTHVALVTIAHGAYACEVDHRTLRLGDDGKAGAFEAGEAGAGRSPATSLGGAGGAEPSPDGLVDGCADLDTDGIADCTTTLVETPSFTSDVSGWTALAGTELSWDPKNALTDLPSGSAKLSGEGAEARARQCVGIDGGQLVIAYANVFVETAGNGDQLAQGKLEVSFYEDGDCGSERHRYFDTPPSAVVDEWTTTHAGGLAIDATRSVAIALVGLKAGSASELNVYFDNVMLKAQQP